jgi:hypothetical protein
VPALFVPNPAAPALLARSPFVLARVAVAAHAIRAKAYDLVRVDSGETAASGRVEATAEGFRVVFGGAAYWLEFGAYGRSYPFLRPAADAVVPGGRRES